MAWFKWIKIRSFEVGLVFRDGEFRELLVPGTYWYWDLRNQLEVAVVSQRQPMLIHDKLDLIVNSGALRERAVVLDLKDHQRGLVWIDGRFSHLLPSGLYAFWTGQATVRCEVIDATQVRFQHPDLKRITAWPNARTLLDVCQVDRQRVGVLFVDGQYIETLPPGLYAFWKGQADAKIVEVDQRELMLDVGGQELMSADKVTLRLNAVVNYQIVDPRRAVTQTDDVRQALYRETQLVLRSVIGSRELDSFLTEKESVATEIESNVRQRAAELGLTIASVGIRDVILPGEMKDLMNKVTEAKKAAEANLIVRREETAAMRSQVNTAKLLADNPTLMRLRELEVLEKIAATTKLSIVLGEAGAGDQGLAAKMVNLL